MAELEADLEADLAADLEADLAANLPVFGILQEGWPTGTRQEKLLQVYSG